MSPRFSVYIGIDVTTGSKPITFVALDPDRKAQAIGVGDVPDALSYAAGQMAGALVAVTAPGRPNNGRMTRDEVRDSLNPAPERGKWRSLRQAEYELTMLGANVPSTPSSAEHSLPWMKRGFNLVERLESLDYRPFSGEESPRQWCEVQPDGGFWSLLGHNPLQAGTLEGRIQRQLVLSDVDLDVPDAMEFFEEITRFKILKGNLPMNYVLNQAEINAWLAAYTAWLAENQPQAVRRFGAEDEGVILLPCENKLRLA